MPAPYIAEFKFNEFIASSVVVDKSDFDTLVDDIIKTGMCTADAGSALKDAQHIVLIKNGTKTKFIFDHFGVKTNLCSVVVRGAGTKVMNKYLKE